MSVREPRTWEYTAIRLVVGWALKLFFRLDSSGSENIPESGGCLVVSNHASYLDPPALACCARHRVFRALARDTLSRSAFTRWLYKGLMTLSIDRTRGDIGALRKALGILTEGGLVFLFPEGTRTRDGELQKAKGGVGFLVSKAGVPVVPAYIDGSYEALPKGRHWPRFRRLSVYFGQPIPPEDIQGLGTDRESYEKIGELLMSHIAALKPQQAPPSA